MPRPLCLQPQLRGRLRTAQQQRAPSSAAGPGPRSPQPPGAARRPRSAAGSAPRLELQHRGRRRRGRAKAARQSGVRRACPAPPAAPCPRRKPAAPGAPALRPPTVAEHRPKPRWALSGGSGRAGEPRLPSRAVAQAAASHRLRLRAPLPRGPSRIFPAKLARERL
ncbi:uncharacterized protein LOC110400062 isoform X1 [Numida meleagris]|uniref:uncharacterized protein LOC110400062 isoform X1 n=1 Tax=Numida meleagris TaxID=8996 RepID=UPI000B3D8692|nr:uncharacterized protein LOC110400062 isoform X1 [Numida meleagris]